MRSKAPLVLIEQMVMLLVFALAAALCLQAFVLSDQRSHRSEARDFAASAAQSAAETVRSCGGGVQDAFAAAAGLLDGSVEDGVLVVEYDEDWQPAADGIYLLTAAEVSSGQPGLASAEVLVSEKNGGEPLFAVTVAWQEVGGNG